MIDMGVAMVVVDGIFEVELVRNETLPVDGGRWLVRVTTGVPPAEVKTFRTKRQATRWIEERTAIRAERWG